jgi:hypothetical protein
MVNHRIEAERRLDAALENLLLAQDLRTASYGLLWMSTRMRPLSRPNGPFVRRRGRILIADLLFGFAWLGLALALYYGEKRWGTH